MINVIEDARSSLLRKVELGPNGVIPCSSPHLQSDPNHPQTSQAVITQHIEKLFKIISSGYTFFYQIVLHYYCEL